jgi:hypothetical protein
MWSYFKLKLSSYISLKILPVLFSSGVICGVFAFFVVPNLDVIGENLYPIVEFRYPSRPNMRTNTNASQPTGVSAQVARLARAATDFRAWEVQEAKDEANTFPVPRGDVFSPTVETPEAAADSGNHPRQPTQTSYFCTRESEASSPSLSTDDVHSNTTPVISTTPTISSSSTGASAKATISKIPTTIIVGGCVVVTVAAVVYWYKSL